MRGFGDYELDEKASTLAARDTKDAKDLVTCVHGTQDPNVGYDLAHALGRNGGQENAVCVTGDVTHTLRAEGFDASEDGTGRGQPIVTTLAIRGRGDGTSNAILTPNGGRAGIGVGAIHYGTSVRRLTPVECERLQGFPDGYTRIAWRGKGDDQCPDGPRYRALGNSMAVPVMAWIGRRIDLADAAFQKAEA